MPHMPHVKTSLHRSDEPRDIEKVKHFKLGSLHGRLGSMPLDRYVVKPELDRLRANPGHGKHKPVPPPPGPDTSPPRIVVNSALVAAIGHTTALSGSVLSATDNSGGTVTFTLTTPPTHGTLTPSTFTQMQINSGAVSYASPLGTTASSDIMSFRVADAASNATTCNFVVSLVADVHVPPSKDWLTVAFQTFGSTDVAAIFPMDGNDRYGDCVTAMLAHARTMYAAMVGVQNVPASQAVIDFYFMLTGGQDVGLSMDSTIQYCMTNGLFGDPLKGYVDTGGGNLDHIRMAIDLFGGCPWAFNFPTNGFNYFSNHYPWVPASTSGGHGVLLTGYDDAGTFVDPNTGKSYLGLFNCLTWGGTQLITYDGLKALGYVGCPIIPAEADQLRWDGLSIQAILDDLKRVAG